MDSKKKETKILKDLKEKVERLERERDEYLNGWKRSKADLVNFKKDMTDSLVRHTDLAKVEFVREILPIVDALREGERSKIEGLIPIQRLLMSILEREGIEEINPQEGEEFDPELHEATHGKGLVVEECRQKGFSYKSYIIRPAKVVVKET